MAAESTVDGTVVARDGHFRNVDGLRAIAAMAVFFTHVGMVRYVGLPVVGLNSVLRNALDELTVGVQLFFGISGFVLMRPFVERHLARRPAVAGTGYFVRRALRIFPAYWAALLGTVFVIRGTWVLHGRWPWIANLLLIQRYSVSAMFAPRFVGLPHAWTLVVEVTFYGFLAAYAALLPRLIRTRDRFTAQWIGLGVIAVAAYAMVVWENVGSVPRWVLVLPESMPYFLAGMTLAVLTLQCEHRGVVPRWLQRAADHPVGCAVVAVSAFAIVATLNSRDKGIWEATLVLHVVLVTALLILAVVPSARPSRVRDALHSRPAVFLGTVSYGIYLWHFAIILWVSKHLVDAREGLTMVKVTLIALPATLAVAWLSLRFVERPCVALGRRLTRHRSGTRLTSTNWLTTLNQ